VPQHRISSDVIYLGTFETILGTVLE
jgi:hypothetical protein